MVKLKTRTKKKQNTRREKDKRDFLSELSDDVLLHIMHFMDTTTAVQTSFLSKRWNKVWKCLTTLSFRRSDFKTLESYDQFVYHVVSKRDTSIRLHRLDLEACTVTQELLNHITPLLHYVSHLSIYLDYSIPVIFSSPSLTSLTLSCTPGILKLPPSLELPALRTLNLANVALTAKDGDECAEPFSSCFLLNSLVLLGCSLSNPAKVLSISNPNLSHFTTIRYSEVKYEILLHTPNLTHIRSSDVRHSHKVCVIFTTKPQSITWYET
ncbi:F-box/LRR-repeat protein At3g03360-like [Vigna radiata var. radiata]|uniref:F-box/LRR-repeat protein At3g03360-like n=1 Tax=Vigna radiata var. radiata TaxID=3916 RepID=A0A1S3U8G1_VIGRR|nr:F-box/LRR-repeat protein At3g03360-like [Vigna radiata var. radiata]